MFKAFVALAAIANAQNEAPAPVNTVAAAPVVRAMPPRAMFVGNNAGGPIASMQYAGRPMASRPIASARNLPVGRPIAQGANMYLNRPLNRPAMASAPRQMPSAPAAVAVAQQKVEKYSTEDKAQRLVELQQKRATAFLFDFAKATGDYEPGDYSIPNVLRWQASQQELDIYDNALEYYRSKGELSDSDQIKLQLAEADREYYQHYTNADLMKIVDLDLDKIYKDQQARADVVRKTIKHEMAVAAAKQDPSESNIKQVDYAAREKVAVSHYSTGQTLSALPQWIDVLDVNSNMGAKGKKWGGLFNYIGLKGVYEINAEKYDEAVKKYRESPSRDTFKSMEIARLKKVFADNKQMSELFGSFIVQDNIDLDLEDNALLRINFNYQANAAKLDEYQIELEDLIRRRRTKEVGKN